MSTLVFVDYEIGASYDKSHQFHKKQGWGLILATHTFLTKHVCNLMPSYLYPSASATDFSWQVFFTLMRVIFHAISTVKCQTIILSDPRMCLITRQILSYHSQLVLKTIRILSGYYQDTIKLSGYNVTFIKLANTKKQKQPNQTHMNFAEELLL